MKKMRKILSVLASLAILGTGLFTACSEDEEETVIESPSYSAKKAIVISGHKSDKIAVDGTEQLKATVLNSSESYTWKTSDEDYITVTDGLVTAVDSTDGEKVQVWAEFADGTKSNEVNYVVQEVVPKITGVTLESNPSKTKYATGTEIDLTGLKIKVNYDVTVPSDIADEYPASVEYSSETASLFSVEGFNSENAAENQSVTVTYKPTDTEFAEDATNTVTFDVTIVAATVSEISVNEDSKLTYALGEKLAVSVHVKYDSDALPEEDITAGYTSTDYDAITVPVAEQEISITYGGKSTTCNVTVTGIAVSTFTISAANNTTAIEKSTTLQFTATVTPETATYKDSKVTWSATGAEGVSISETGLLTAGTNCGTVTVKATVTDISDPTSEKTVDSNSIEITINPSINSIAVNTENAKTTYGVGETFSSSGIVVTGTYEDSTESAPHTADVTSGCTFSTVDTSSKGTKQVTVTHTASGKTATFDIEVQQREIPYELDFNVFSSLATAENTTNATSGSYDLGMIALRADGSKLRIRKTTSNSTSTYSLNYNGQNYDSIGDEGSSIAVPSAPYVAINLPKLYTGEVKSAVVSISVTTTGSGTASTDAKLALTDGSKVLAMRSDLDETQGDAKREKVYELSATVTDFTKTIYIGFNRGSTASAGGGIDIKSITIAEAQAAPANVTATAPTSSDNNDGKITISDFASGSTLQYKLSTASEWSESASGTIENLVPGDYYVRYAANGTKGASAIVTVTVEKYVNPALPQAKTPELSVFTVTAATTKEQNNGEIKWNSFNITVDSGNIAEIAATIEYQKEGDASWTTASGTSITALEAPATYKLRVAAVDDVCKASDSVEVKVKGFKAQPVVNSDGLVMTFTETTEENETVTGSLTIPSTMQYYTANEKSDNPTWTTGTGSAITGIALETKYFVRYAETTDYAASEVTTVTVSNAASVDLPATWVAGDTNPSWLTGVGTASNNSRKAFGTSTTAKYSKSVPIAANSTFTITTSNAGTVTIYMSADDGGDTKGTATAKVENTTLSTYAFKGRDTDDSTPWTFTVEANKTISITNSYKILLFEISTP